MKAFILFLWHVVLFTTLFMITTVIGAIALVTYAQQGGAGAAVVIALSSIIGNLLLFIFITFKYKPMRAAKLAGIVGLFLFLPALLLLNVQYMTLNAFNW